jgi:DnaJ-class molecular chaperone
MRSLTETIDCAECAGTGEVEIEVYDVASFSNPYGDITVRYDVCPECSGSGEKETDD